MLLTRSAVSVLAVGAGLTMSPLAGLSGPIGAVLLLLGMGLVVLAVHGLDFEQRVTVIRYSFWAFVVGTVPYGIGAGLGTGSTAGIGGAFADPWLLSIYFAVSFGGLFACLVTLMWNVVETGNLVVRSDQEGPS
ncbi:MAG: hypothetical protein V5A62_03910 [Haloarculaceae archaeon]